MKQLFKTTLVLVALAFSLNVQAAEVDLAQSQIKWLGSKITGDKHIGKIGIKEAKLQNEGDKITGGEFVVDLNSITVEDLEGQWATKFLNHMKGEDFFEISKHPTAKLVINSIDDKNMKGSLTIKGKTNPVSFAYTKQDKTYTGELKFDRTKFDMVYGSKNFFKNLGDKVINDEVVLTAKIVLK